MKKKKKLYKKDVGKTFEVYDGAEVIGYVRVAAIARNPASKDCLFVIFKDCRQNGGWADLLHIEDCRREHELIDIFEAWMVDSPYFVEANRLVATIQGATDQDFRSIIDAVMEEHRREIRENAEWLRKFRTLKKKVT